MPRTIPPPRRKSKRTKKPKGNNNTRSKRTKFAVNMGGFYSNPPDYCHFKVFVHNRWWVDCVLCKYHCNEEYTHDCPKYQHSMERSKWVRKKGIEEEKRIEKEESRRLKREERKEEKKRRRGLRSLLKRKSRRTK